MSVSDVFQSELIFVIKELITAAQLEIAKVVISCGNGDVSMSTEETNTKLLCTREAQKKDMILISSILEMFGREAVRKLNRIFTECCAALQNECQQSKQENNSLKRRIKDMKRPKIIKTLISAKGKSRSSLKRTQMHPTPAPFTETTGVPVMLTTPTAPLTTSTGNAGLPVMLTATAAPLPTSTGNAGVPVILTATAAPITTSTGNTGLPPLTSPPLMSTDTFQKDESRGMASSTQHNGLDTDSSLTDDSGGEINGYESQEDVSAVGGDALNVGDRSHHQLSNRKTLPVDLSLTPPDPFLPSSERNKTNQQIDKTKPEKLHGCDQCEKKYRTKKSLRRHKVSHDRKSQQDTSLKQKKDKLTRFKSQGLQESPNSQKVCEYKCDICDKVYTNGRSLKFHRLMMHLGVKPFSCSECGQGFTSFSSLKNHQRIHTGEKPFMCTTCGKRFTQSGDLRVHERRHSGEKSHKCDQCPKAFFNLQALNQHKVSHTGEKPHKCDLCEKSFGLINNLKRHRLLHTGVKPYVCVVCSKSYSQAVGLKLHMLVHGEGEKPFKCEICGKAFVYKYALKYHMFKHDGNTVNRTVKKPGNPVKCPVCGKCCSTPSALKLHTMVHSGQKPFKCEVCNKAFAQKGACTQHAKIHTGEEKPLKCSVCSKRFRTRQTLNTHMRIHTGERPYKCQTCGLAFNADSNFKRHIRVHTGEKPFSCDVCGKRFGQLNNVKAHMQVHTGERPHFCDRCGRRFACVKNLRKHKCVPC